MNILYVAAEVAPFVKTGGLGDVAGALPQALRALGHDARIVMPLYQQIHASSLPRSAPLAGSFLPIGYHQEELRIRTTTLGETLVYLLEIPAAFARMSIYGDDDDDRRFILFCRAVMNLLQHLREVTGWQPHVLHANDWHTALLPNYLKTFYSYTFGHIASIYTIHNLAYQGRYSETTRVLAGVNDWGEQALNFMARGIAYADIVSTVSPTYARAILTQPAGEGLDGLLRMRQDRLVGILNGIDWQVNNPATDQQIAAQYDASNPAGKAQCKAALQHECGWPADQGRMLIGMVSRLTEQKGFDLVQAALPWLLAETDAQLVVLATGQPALEAMLQAYANTRPDRIVVYLRFDAALAQRIYAGSDAFLMPSRYEPGGLSQLIALRYGSVPIVRATGGLNDTVREGYEGNGFRFHPYEAKELIAAMARCLEAYHDTAGWPLLRARGMREDHSWERAAQEYVDLYTRAVHQIGRDVR